MLVTYRHEQYRAMDTSPPAVSASAATTGWNNLPVDISAHHFNGSDGALGP